MAEVETDKATMEVECFEEGILIKQYCKQGEEVPVGGAIAAVGEAGEHGGRVYARRDPRCGRCEGGRGASGGRRGRVLDHQYGRGLGRLSVQGFRRREHEALTASQSE